MKNIYIYLSLFVLLISCSDNSTDPPHQNLTNDIVKGNYTTIVFSLNNNGSITDILQGGGFINVNLFSDGTTTGEFFVPKSITGDSTDTDVDLQGTFTIVNDSIRFQHSADTFIRDTKWAFQEDKLSGHFNSSSASIIVELGR